MIAHWSTLSAYLLVLLGAIATTIGSRVRPERVPSFTRALIRAMHTRSAAIGLVVAWWWIGWHFLTGS